MQISSPSTSSSPSLFLIGLQFTKFSLIKSFVDLPSSSQSPSPPYSTILHVTKPIMIMIISLPLCCSHKLENTQAHSCTSSNVTTTTQTQLVWLLHAVLILSSFKNLCWCHTHNFIDILRIFKKSLLDTPFSSPGYNESPIIFQKETSKSYTNIIRIYVALLLMMRHSHSNTTENTLMSLCFAQHNIFRSL